MFYKGTKLFFIAWHIVLKKDHITDNNRREREKEKKERERSRVKEREGGTEEEKSKLHGKQKST